MINPRLFLLPTVFCDSDNPEIRATQEIICEGEKDPIKQALLIKKWIENHIIYRFDFLDVKASQTLEKRFGQCMNRANLQVALLRAAKIPAGYGVTSITKEVFREITPAEFYERIGESTIHIYCVVYDLEIGKWRHFDAIAHPALQKVYHVKNIELRRHTPEGESQYREDYLRSEISVHSNIDHFLVVPHRWLTQAYIDLANEFLEGLEMRCAR